MAWLLLAGLLHPGAGLLAIIALLLFYILYYAPPQNLLSILLLVGGIIAALTLAIIGWRKAPRERLNLNKSLVLGITILLIGSALLGPRLGFGLAGIAGATELGELKKAGARWYWRYLGSIFLPRLSFFILWLLLLGYTLKYLADL
ncbi:hypothetical protein SAMN00808754_2584 [Thermanaeromonas toyohensis ToBE]|uniref:Uncharacterized protein n=1 Tax=Thermanaeromonas toyohensis ToBE TaxID=698762 RepID=A0A1W1VZR2_9FIRM|nr:hypothetical protein SAMN00808754_2584 [Thermanaeromonas toyohensis ToBE]